MASSWRDWLVKKLIEDQAALGQISDVGEEIGQRQSMAPGISVTPEEVMAQRQAMGEAPGLGERFLRGAGESALGQLGGMAQMTSPVGTGQALMNALGMGAGPELGQVMGEAVAAPPPIGMAEGLVDVLGGITPDVLASTAIPSGPGELGRPKIPRDAKTGRFVAGKRVPQGRDPWTGKFTSESLEDILARRREEYNTTLRKKDLTRGKGGRFTSKGSEIPDPMERATDYLRQIKEYPQRRDRLQLASDAIRELEKVPSNPMLENTIRSLKAQRDLLEAHRQSSKIPDDWMASPLMTDVVKEVRRDFLESMARGGEGWESMAGAMQAEPYMGAIHDTSTGAYMHNSSFPSTIGQSMRVDDPFQAIGHEVTHGIVDELQRRSPLTAKWRSTNNEAIQLIRARTQLRKLAEMEPRLRKVFLRYLDTEATATNNIPLKKVVGRISHPAKLDAISANEIDSRLKNVLPKLEKEFGDRETYVLGKLGREEGWMGKEMADNPFARTLKTLHEAAFKHPYRERGSAIRHQLAGGASSIYKRSMTDPLLDEVVRLRHGPDEDIADLGQSMVYWPEELGPEVRDLLMEQFGDLSVPPFE